MTASRSPLGLLAALPDLGLAAVALLTWVRPTLLGTDLVRWFVLLMLLEFVVVHSSAFLGRVAYGPGSRARRIRNTVLLGLLYTVCLIGFALAFSSMWPIVAFWALTANRLLGALVGQAPAGHEVDFVTSGWAVSAVFYILCVIPVTILPLPRFGIDPSMLGTLGGNSGGQWVSEPHRAVAFAMLYFGAVGVSELFGHLWLRQGGR